MNDDRRLELAFRILADCRVRLTMTFRFLDRALWQMPIEAEEAQALLATDGIALRTCAEEAIQAYRKLPDIVARTYLHSVLHCVFRHPFHTVRQEPQLWNLACDICVEAIAVQQCDGRFPLEGDEAIEHFAQRLEEKGIALVPAQIYRALLQAKAKPELDPILASFACSPVDAGSLFARDSHEAWDLVPPEPEETRKTLSRDPHMQPRESSRNRPSREAVEESMQYMPREFENKHRQRKNEANVNVDGDEHIGTTLSANRKNNPHRANPEESGVQSVSKGAHSPRLSHDQAEKEWQSIARQIETDLKSSTKQRGSGGGYLSDNLTLVDRSSIDYTSFLRRFCAYSEGPKVNEDEFDYLFYTYGLALYGNMPLVEPLEYKEERRLQEFVIAIDTSGSCTEGLVDIFLTRTCEILEQANTATDRVNIRIIQCDAAIQEERIATNAEEFRNLSGDFTVKGFGGTDFRPVFHHVDQLIRDGGISRLKGLIYFTDGFGEFPAAPPDYEVAFVFVESAGKERYVPPWAMKVIMSEDDIEQLQPEGSIGQRWIAQQSSS